MNDFIPLCVWPLGAELGEGPIWHDVERALYFVGIKGKKYIAGNPIHISAAAGPHLLNPVLS
jgi:sugar lactone lactonase YvrE